MANSLQVRPGDVISSDFMNQILNSINAIDQRITILENQLPSTDQVAIDTFEPPVQVEAGQLLILHGRYFAFPPTRNIITISGFAVPVENIRPDSTTSRLKFIVPKDIHVPVGGNNYTIRVVTPTKGSAQKDYRLLPALEAVGSPPNITSVTRASTGSPTLRVNENARITGQHFAADPNDNVITFKIETVSPAVTYPLAGQTLTIDLEQSNTNQIVVTVPNILEIAAGESAPVTVEVGVGVHPHTVYVASVRRPGA